MNPLIFALQFVSVAIPAVVGVLWLVSNFISAWHIRTTRTNAAVLANAVFGVIVLGISVLLAGLYGWIPA